MEHPFNKRVNILFSRSYFVFDIFLCLANKFFKCKLLECLEFSDTFKHQSFN